MISDIFIDRPRLAFVVSIVITLAGATGLVSAIEGLENSHPEVTATVSNVARMLSKLGF